MYYKKKIPGVSGSGDEYQGSVLFDLLGLSFLNHLLVRRAVEEAGGGIDDDSAEACKGIGEDGAEVGRHLTDTGNEVTAPLL